MLSNFSGIQQQRHITILRNGDFAVSKDMFVDIEWSFDDFLSAAGRRLEMCEGDAKRVFHSNGEEVKDCISILDDDCLIISDDRPYKMLEEVSKHQPKSVGHYSVGQLLGSGGYGRVYAGKNIVSGQTVALKFISKAEIHSLRDAQRAMSEYQVLQSLNHRNIIKLYSYFDASKHAIMVVEYVAGGNLRDFLISRSVLTATHGVLTETEAKTVFSKMMSGLSYAHAHNIIHHNLKLENVLLTNAGSISEVKIADFGLAEFCGATHKNTALMNAASATGSFDAVVSVGAAGATTGTSSSMTRAGNMSYLAPELFLNASVKNTKSDVWATGVILFALLCGRLPFGGSDLTYKDRPDDSVTKARIISGSYKIDKQLSDDAKALLQHLLATDPSCRPSASDVFGSAWLLGWEGVEDGDDCATARSVASHRDQLVDALDRTLQSPDTDTVSELGADTGSGRRTDAITSFSQKAPSSTSIITPISESASEKFRVSATGRMFAVRQELRLAKEKIEKDLKGTDTPAYVSTSFSTSSEKSGRRASMGAYYTHSGRISDKEKGEDEDEGNGDTDKVGDSVGGGGGGGSAVPRRKPAVPKLRSSFTIGAGGSIPAAIATAVGTVAKASASGVGGGARLVSARGNGNGSGSATGTLASLRDPQNLFSSQLQDTLSRSLENSPVTTTNTRKSSVSVSITKHQGT